MNRTTRFFVTAIAILAALSFTGCDSSSDGGTTGQGGGGGLDSIPALGDMTIYDGDAESTTPEAWENPGDYDIVEEGLSLSDDDGNNVLSLEFSADPPAAVLMDNTDLPPGMTATPDDAKFYAVDIIVNDGSGEQVGEIALFDYSQITDDNLTSFSGTISEVSFFWVDKDVTFAGTVDYDGVDAVWNASLSAGWNTVVETFTFTSFDFTAGGDTTPTAITAGVGAIPSGARYYYTSDF